MRFGIFVLGDKPPQLTHQEVLANVLEEARWAEEFGFDEVWLAEHHFSPYGTLANLPQIAAAIAAQTERIRIGTACMVAPFHDPIHLAEQIATIDALSGGRFDAGFGRGYQAHEFAGFGVSMDEATARYQECVAMVEGLLTNERFSHEGQFWTVDDLTIHPRPVQQPVPIWCTVMKTPASFEWLAETGYGAIIGNPYQVDADLATGLQLYLESASGGTCRRPPSTCGRCSTRSSTTTTRSRASIPVAASSSRSRCTASTRTRSSAAVRSPPTTRRTPTGSTSTTTRATSRSSTPTSRSWAAPTASSRRWPRSSTWAGRTSCSA